MKDTTKGNLRQEPAPPNPAAPTGPTKLFSPSAPLLRPARTNPGNSRARGHGEGRGCLRRRGQRTSEPVLFEHAPDGALIPAGEPAPGISALLAVAIWLAIRGGRGSCPRSPSAAGSVREEASGAGGAMRRPRERGQCSPRKGAAREAPARPPARLPTRLPASWRGHRPESCAPGLLPLPPLPGLALPPPAPLFSF